MSQDDRSTPPEADRRPLLELVEPLAWLLLVAFGAYGLCAWLAGYQSAVTIGWTILVVLPFSIGAMARLLLAARGHKDAALGAVLAAILFVLGVGAIVLREAVICVVILAPLWILSAILGSFAVAYFHDALNRPDRRNVFVLAALPFMAVFVDANLPPPIERFTVTRSIVIDARPDEIWPHLLKLDGLRLDEGVWNLAQDVFGIPRPTSATVVGEGPGSIRYARWGGDIRFEERITDWQENHRLVWAFAFPDDSISRYTDAHIHPDGANLKIESGAYHLSPLADGKTLLELRTSYLARTPVNAYAALWGELFLGDIQTNILAIAKHRTE